MPRKYSEEYLLSLLTEAPNDNPTMGQTNTMSNDPNAAYEPQEQDASMGVEDSMGNMDPGMDEMDMGDGSMNPGMDSGMGMDAGMGGEAPVNTKDLFKKRKLFDDYKELLNTIENAMEASAHMISKDLPKDASKVYRFITNKMEENKQKLIIILSEQFFNLSYQQLLTIYMYVKMSAKLYADMIKQINDLYYDED